MGSDDLKNLNVLNIAEENSVLFMWATFPKLKDAIELGGSWGFVYKTVAFTWIKRNKRSPTFFMGMGYYTRSNAEICLLFTRGKPLHRISKSVLQICDSPVQRHSQKPVEINSRIVSLFGDISRIELFARNKTDGWDVWGNEVESDIDLLTK
jgi:N6-adenosine-specific RNA methylase IME4